MAWPRILGRQLNTKRLLAQRAHRAESLNMGDRNASMPRFSRDGRGQCRFRGLDASLASPISLQEIRLAGRKTGWTGEGRQKEGSKDGRPTVHRSWFSGAAGEAAKGFFPTRSRAIVKSLESDRNWRAADPHTLGCRRTT